MTSLLVLLAACGGSQKPDPTAAPETPSTEEPTAATATAPAPEGVKVATSVGSRAAPRPEFSGLATDFALRFHGELADGNTATSGVSAQFALSMLAAGAKGDTLGEFSTLFGTDADEAWHADQARAMAAYADTPGVELEVANALWIQQGLPIEEPFEKLLTESYLAPAERLDFGDTAAAAKRINTWTNEKTHEMIPELFQPDALKGVKLVLANAIAFKGKWANEFDAESTKPGSFATPSGAAEVPMMHAAMKGLSYLEGEGFKAISLPYVDNGASMIIVLPDEGVSLDDVEKGFDAQRLGRMTMSGSRPVNVTIPKWKTEQEYDLKPALRDMGLDAALGQADYSGMSSEPLAVDKIIQKVFVQVDEEGTEAAAVTGVTMKRTAMVQEPVDFVADRPFFWAIWHRETQTPLFTGRVVDPR